MTLEEKVASWIEAQGYPLEMQVAEYVRASRGWWDHGRTYVDPETGKTREVDVMAIFDAGQGTRSSVQLVVECKHTRDKPWVVFTTDNHVLSPFGYLSGLPHTQAADSVLDRLDAKQTAARRTTFAQPEREGFRLVKAFSPAQDTAYQAVGTLMNGCRSLAELMGSRSDSHILFVPVLVLDGPLFECSLPPDEASSVTREVPSATLVQPVGDGGRMPIKVITIDALPAYLDAVGQDAAWWGELMTT
jgi:hypothetical protein